MLEIYVFWNNFHKSISQTTINNQKNFQYRLIIPALIIILILLYTQLGVSHTGSTGVDDPDKGDWIINILILLNRSFLY